MDFANAVGQTRNQNRIKYHPMVVVKIKKSSMSEKKKKMSSNKPNNQKMERSSASRTPSQLSNNIFGGVTAFFQGAPQEEEKNSTSDSLRNPPKTAPLLHFDALFSPTSSRQNTESESPLRIVGKKLDSYASSVQSLCIVGTEVWACSKNNIMIYDPFKQTLKHQIRDAHVHPKLVTSLLFIEMASSPKFSPSTQFVWSAGFDGAIRIWETKEYNNYKCVHTIVLPNHHDVFSLTRILNHVWILTNDMLFIAHLDGKILSSTALHYPAALAQVENYVWISSSEKITVFPIPKSNQNSVGILKSFGKDQKGAEAVSCIAFRYPYVWAGDKQGDITIWSCETFESIMTLREAHKGQVFTLHVMDQQGGQIWSTGKDNIIRMWDPETMMCVDEINNHDDNVFSVLAVEKRIVWTGSHTITAWTLPYRTQLFSQISYGEHGNPEKYVGEVIAPTPETPVRHGRGEMHWQSGEIYVGSWKGDKRQGFGVATFPNKEKYYGEWFQDQASGHGVYIWTDGTVFQGSWNLGHRRGYGEQLFPNGDRLVGDWLKDDLKNARYIKGNVTRLPSCVQELFTAVNDSSINKARESKRPIPFHKWPAFAPANAIFIEKELRKKKEINIQTLSVMCSNNDNPIGSAIADFAHVFNASYHFTYGQPKVLLFNAIDDIHSFLRSMEKTVTQSVKLNAAQVSFTLCDILMVKIFNVLISLYQEVNQHKDSFLSVKLHSLKKASPERIGISRKFRLPNCEQPYQEVFNRLSQITNIKTVSKKLACIIGVSESIIRAVDEYYHPEQKIQNLELTLSGGSSSSDALSDSNNSLNTSANNNNAANSVTSPNTAVRQDPIALGAEDKLPILCYVLIQANVPALYSEVCFIKEFSNADILKLEIQYRLTEFEQAISYLESVDWNVVDPYGVLISVASLEKSVIDVVKTNRGMYQHLHNQSPKLLWLAEILLQIGIQENHTSDFELSYEHAQICQDPAYFELASEVFDSLSLSLVKDSYLLKNKTPTMKVSFRHTYPSYIYTAMSTAVEKYIKSLSN